MKIFIAGCGRSGTTLTRDLMRCFEGVYAHKREAPISLFDRLEDQKVPNLIVKRTSACYKTLHKLPADIKLLYCVRHPFDTLTSSHRLTVDRRRFHITEDRWKREYRSLHRLQERQPDRPIFILRYEDLIKDPDGIQKQIAKHFGLTIDHLFTKNAEGIEIHPDSLEKWRKSPELAAYVNGFDPAWKEKIAKFCEEFGYSLPRNYARQGGIFSMLGWNRRRVTKAKVA
jgi:hypothetical protein